MKKLSKSSVAAKPRKARTVTAYSEPIVQEKVLDLRVRKVLLADKQTANVLLTVIEFNEITNIRHATPTTMTDIQLLGTNSRVTQPQGARNSAILNVTGGGPLNFHFMISPGTTRTVYYPVGIGFKLKTPGLSADKQCIARQNFASDAVHIYGTSLFFTDDYRQESYGDLFTYYVIIQREDGQVGIIDPGILHTNPPSGTPAAAS
jgi:hypothetical protein